MSDDLFRNEERDRADADRLEAMRRSNTVNLKAFFLTVAIVIAPFLAMPFGLDVALGVLAVGLAFSAWLTWIGGNHVAPALRSRLRAAAMLNIGVLLMVVLVIVMRIVA